MKKAQIFLGKDKEEDFLLGAIPLEPYMLNEYGILLPEMSITNYGSKPEIAAESFAKKMKECNISGYSIVNGKKLLSKNVIINSNFKVSQEDLDTFKKTLEEKLKQKGEVK
ncbi:MAG: hypothetical protein WC812_03110 [Candidatus Pacearchaeota archaeon]|jgi:hypothetical protein